MKSDIFALNFYENRKKLYETFVSHVGNYLDNRKIISS